MNRIKVGNWVRKPNGFPSTGMVVAVKEGDGYVDSLQSATWVPLVELVKISFRESGFCAASRKQIRKLHSI